MAANTHSAMRRSISVRLAASTVNELDDIPEEGPQVSKPQFPDDDLRRAPASLVLVARNLGHPIALLQGLHQHLLLDRGQIRGETEFPCDIFPDRAEAILAVGQPDIPAVVDSQHDELRAK